MHQFYIGLDVSRDETSICLVDAKGAIVQELTASSDP
jgi:predicted NBD/HSP70 family sugar kinase